MKKTIATLGICTLAVSCSGCSTWSKGSTKSNESPWSISKMWKKEYQKPQSIAVIWAPDVLTLPGKPATRGFGGRIYFYNEKSQAVPIDGDLIVHGYLKQSRHGESEQVAADKTFAFTAEQLVTHFSPSEIGASYSIWIPWDAVEDGMRAEVTLIPTFTSKDGTIIQGTPAKVNLPGKKDLADDTRRSGLMQTVSYSSSSTPTNPGFVTPPEKQTMRTMTINVPSNATIAKNRRVQAFTLGNESAQQVTPPVSVAGEGVTTGGGSSPSVSTENSHVPLPTTLLPQSQSTSNSTTLPSLSTRPSAFGQTDVRQLAPPPKPSAFSPAIPPQPASQAQWVRPNVPVSPASFTR